MIIIIQALVIITALGLIVFVMGVRQSYAARAWKKIALCLLAFAMVFAVMFPDSTNRAAHLVGVGRGADLLLYLLVLAFIANALNTYLHQQRERETVFRVARKVALVEAMQRYGLNKK